MPGMTIETWVLPLQGPRSTSHRWHLWARQQVPVQGAEDGQPRNLNGSSSGQEKGGYMVDSGSVRPLNPAEVQAAASMSSAQGTDSGTGTGETPAAQLIDNKACACKGRQA